MGTHIGRGTIMTVQNYIRLGMGRMFVIALDELDHLIIQIRYGCEVAPAVQLAGARSRPSETGQGGSPVCSQTPSSKC